MKNSWITISLLLIVISMNFFPKMALAESSQGQEIKLVEKITELTDIIKGETVPDASILVENNARVIGSGQSDAEGNFQITIEKQQVNTILKITAQTGSGTYFIEVTVQQTFQTGWVSSQGEWMYKDQDGNLITGWLYDSGQWYFLNENGVMETGWLWEGGNWYLLNSSGAMETGWEMLGDQWYFFDETGRMKTGWVHDHQNWYFLHHSGAMATGWVLDGAHWYYLGLNGAMKTGWLYEYGYWYYLTQSGAMRTGWQWDAGKWYYFNHLGVMQVGWIQSGTDQYYLGPSGAVSSVLLDVPLISQMPELPRGCEVTSLAMMLWDAGARVDKMTLAAQVRKDPTPYSKTGGQVYFGNPYSGFVGDMYTFSKPGLAVYHGPIADLAEMYLPNRVVDFTGSEFEEIFNYLNSGYPVWVINNVMFDTVPAQYWQTWNTPTGRISITYKEHSVLVTGYDSQYIYFNDPLANMKNRKVSISAFKRGWVQMGKQAISYQ